MVNALDGPRVGLGQAMGMLAADGMYKYEVSQYVYKLFVSFFSNYTNARHRVWLGRTHVGSMFHPSRTVCMSVCMRSLQVQCARAAPGSHDLLLTGGLSEARYMGLELSSVRLLSPCSL